MEEERRPYRFVVVPVAVLESRVPHTAFRLYSWLAWFANKDGAGWPSIRTLAERSGLSALTVRRALRELEDAGIIRREARFNGSRQTSNRYDLVLPGGSDVIPGGSKPDRDGGFTDGSPGTRGLGTRAPMKGATGSETDPVAEERKRLRKDLFEAVSKACGWETKHMTRQARGRVGQAVNDLLDLPEAPTPEELGVFATFWERHYPGADLTPQAITGNWPSWKSGKLFKDGRGRR